MSARKRRTRISASSNAPLVAGRERVRMDSDWRFHLGEVPGCALGQSIPIWRVKMLGKEKPADDSLAAPDVDTSGEDWRGVAPRQDAFGKQPGFAWFCADLPDVPGPHRTLHFTSVDNIGTIHLNGIKLFEYDRWFESFEVPLDRAWREGRSNRLAVLVENQYGPGCIAETEVVSSSAEEGIPDAARTRYDDATWRNVHLPHDFIVEGTFTPSANVSLGFLPRNIGWYRKLFDLPASDGGKTLWIEFDGAFRDSRVWFNGHLLGRHKSGYTGIRHDITALARLGGENVLTVRVDARAGEGWWYEGGGLYRHVWLNKAAPLHVKPWGVFVASKPRGGGADVAVRTTLVNNSRTDENFRLTSEVHDPGGRTLARAIRPVLLKKGAQATVSQKVRLKKAALWSPDSPRLYRLVTKVERGGRVVDRVETSFGVRTVRFDKDKGFFLNGQPLKLQGTCNHQDHAGVGIAIPDKIFEYRVERLKAMGSNAYRCAHNPPAPELLDACDRLGMLVIDENRRLGDSPEVLGQLESMVLRDRNHPSIILWSLCNEEGKQGTPEGLRMGTAMKALVRRLDDTRLVTAAMNFGFGEGLSKVVDLQGFNYSIRQYVEFRRNHPGKFLFGSETASTVSSRGEYSTDKDKGYVSAYDVNHTEWSHPAEAAWRPIAERPYIAGGFVWTGFDYRGEPTPYGWPCVNSHFGILDTCGFPKDNFWYYKSWWGTEMQLHVFPHWNWKGREDAEIDVWVHSNLDMVELFVNGKSRNIKEMPRYGHLEWKVRYEPGTLTAKGYKDGKIVMETTVETTGEPHALRLTPYATEMQADNQDALPVTVEVVDEKGRVVPTAANEVRFKVSGPARIGGVGNGDPSSHEPDKADKRRAFHGMCMVILQGGDRSGDVTLTAESDGLAPASVTLRCRNS